MASILSAGTTSATALNMSADTSGVLQLASNNGTVALTITTAQYVGIGTTTPANVLTLNSGYVQVGNGVGGGGGVHFPYSSDPLGRTWRVRTDITGYGDFGFEQSTTQTGTTYATRLLISQSGVLQFNSGYGSVATAYGCRAWVKFAGGSATIYGSGNISSVTRNSAGNYSCNFVSALVDTNYAAIATADIGGWNTGSTQTGGLGTTTVSCNSRNLSMVNTDADVSLAVFR